MGLNKKGANVKYVRLKNGKFYLSSDKELSEPFDELEGRVVDFFFRDEDYQGTVTKKLYIAIADAVDKYLLGLNFESSYTSKLLAFLKNADLTKNLSISIGTEDASFNGKDWTKTTLFVNQNGRSVSAAYTKANPNGLPEMKKVKVGNKTVWDKSDFLDFYENLVRNVLKPQLEGESTPVEGKNDDEGKDKAPWEVESNDADLPFE